MKRWEEILYRVLGVTFWLLLALAVYLFFVLILGG